VLRVQPAGAAARPRSVAANSAYDIGSPGVPPAGRRSRLLWAAGVAAVIGVVTVAVLLAVLPAGPAPGHRPGRAVPPAAMPRYYVTISRYVVHPEAVVRESASGNVTGQVAIPATARTAVVLVTAAADDRSFVIGGYETGPAGSLDMRFFRLRLGAGGRPGPLTELPRVAVPLLTGVRDSAVQGVTGIALSPDGTMLAVSLQYQAPSMEPLHYGGIEVINLVTGATRTWISGELTYWPGPPSWVGGDRMIEFAWWHDLSLAGQLPPALAGIRQLEVAAPGRNLLDSRLIRGVAGRSVYSALVAPDGRDVIASTCRDVAGPGDRSGTVTGQIVELSVPDGRLIRVLRRQTARYQVTGGENPLNASCSVLSLDPTGTQVLAVCFQLGRIEGGVFTALPGAPVPEGVAAAW
jgi:hypothetical protein